MESLDLWLHTSAAANARVRRHGAAEADSAAETTSAGIGKRNGVEPFIERLIHLLLELNDGKCNGIENCHK